MDSRISAAALYTYALTPMSEDEDYRSSDDDAAVSDEDDDRGGSLSLMTLDSVEDEEAGGLSNSVVRPVPPLPLNGHDTDVDAAAVAARIRVLDDDDDDVPAPAPANPIPVGGRLINDCWKYLSSEPGQHLAVQTKCMTCGRWVRHHKKSEKVKAHLNQCKPFLSAVRGGTLKIGNHDKGVVLPGWIVLRDARGGKKRRASSTPSPLLPKRTALQIPATTRASASYDATNTTPSSTGSRRQQINKKMKRTSTMRDYLIPPMTALDQAAFQDEIAMHFFMTATSFYRLEEIHLLQALRKLRPDVKLPTRKDMSGKQLTKAYKRVKTKVDNWMKRDHFACITSDAWSNIKNESVINYMMVSGELTLFLESTQSGEQSHTSEYLAADLTRVIGSTQGKLSGVIMDNTAANKKTWKILKEVHPRMFFQGCVAHGLNLLVKDVFAASKVKLGRAVADYPDGYPFAPLLDFAADCKKIVKYFHNHHAPKAILKKAFLASRLKSLVMMAPTRWCSLNAMFKSLLEGEEVLYQVVSARDFVAGTAAQKAERQGIVDTITNPGFVPLLQKAIEILTPIDAAIVYYQSDQVPISEVYRTFSSKLPLSIAAMKLISDTERAYLLQLVEKRMLFMYGDAHGIAYLLDPRYLGAGMSMEKRLAVEELILAHPSTSDESNNKPTVEQQQSIFEDYTNFRITINEMKRVGTTFWGMLECGRISPLKFWLSEGDSFPLLQQLARQVFSMVASSAASERNFSAFAFVHTKLRNRLSNDAVEKLVYIRTNNMQFMQQEQKRQGLPVEAIDILEGSESDCQVSTSSQHEVIEL